MRHGYIADRAIAHPHMRGMYLIHIRDFPTSPQTQREIFETGVQNPELYNNMVRYFRKSDWLANAGRVLW